jgi:hypothetical protein
MHDFRMTRLVFAAAVLVTVAACSGSTPTTATPGSASVAASDTATPGGASASVPQASGSRPSSPAVVAIVQPTSGVSVTGTTVHVVISLTGAKIVSATTTNVQPDQGHVHLYVDNVLVSMNYGLEQDLPVTPGTYVLKAEFVASDHAPFDPRVWSPEVFFTVK